MSATNRTQEALNLAYAYATAKERHGTVGSLPEREAMHEAIEALGMDAARYRWLRDDAGSYNGEAPLVVMADDRGQVLKDRRGTPEWREGARLDASIDAAIARSRP